MSRQCLSLQAWRTLGGCEAMRRQAHLQRHTVVYEKDGVEIARYTVLAASERTAERRTTKLFFKAHPKLEFAILPGLTFRIETGDA